MKSQLFLLAIVCAACSGVFATASPRKINKPSIATCTTLPQISVTADSAKKTELRTLVKDVERLLQYGLYGKALERSSSQLNNVPVPDPRLSYMRGVAAWRLGLFRLAERDLSRLGEFKPYDNWAPASSYLLKIRKMQALVPPMTSEVRVDGKVRFRVFSPKNSAWSTAVAKTLPLAYQTNQAMTQSETYPTRVFLFERYEDFKTFYKLRGNGEAPGSWVWAVGDANFMFFCPDVPGASPKIKDVNSDYFRTTIVHEYNHAQVNAIAGSASMPMWLQEGLATVVQNQVSAANTKSTGQRMQRVLTVKAFLPLNEIASRQQFVKSTEVYVTKSRQNQACADPYPQAYFMANYFLSLMPSDALQPFLAEIGSRHNFEAVFQKYTRRTQGQFYREWMAQLPHQLGVTSTPAPKYALRQKADADEQGGQRNGSQSAWTDTRHQG